MVLQREFLNEFTTTLDGAITAAAVSITVDAVAPEAGEFTIKIEDELMRVTAGGTTLTWTVVRGTQGTSGATHSDAKKISAVLTKEDLDSMGDASAARVFNNASVSIPTGVFTAIPLDGEDFDTETYHDNVINNTRLTAPRDGIYSISARVRWQGNSSGVRTLQLRRGGVDSIAREQEPGPPAGELPQTLAIASFRLLSGDFVEILAFQNSGGSLNVQATLDDSVVLDIVRIGDL